MLRASSTPAVVMATLLLLLIAGDVIPATRGHVVDNGNAAQSRHKRAAVSPSDREACKTGVNPSKVAVNTTNILASIRANLKPSQLAYLLPMGDQHQSEYVAETDKWIQFVSGFSGSAGDVVITPDTALLWTDGRYFLQAEHELDCNWVVMRQGMAGVPSIAEWLSENVDSNVGADKELLSHDRWSRLSKATGGKPTLYDDSVQNMIGEIWTDRPTRSDHPLLVLNESFSGESWQKKVDRLRAWLGDYSDSVVITALDEVAWLYNLRGTDVPFNPVFFSYSIVTKTTATIYMDVSRLTAEITSHLNRSDNCDVIECVQVKAYQDFWADLGTVGSKRMWVSPMSSEKVVSEVKEKHLKPSPVRSMKGRKNPTEIAGLRKCHNRDSVAVIEFLTLLEREVKAGESWDEIKASDKLESLRSEKLYYQGLSFATISGSGENGAIIHYKATNETNRAITTSDMYLLDSGGQYLDGTTDVTRTMHFGNPTAFQKEAYTRVLMGVIELARAIWINGTMGRDIDGLARAPLWKAGLDYRHGTGHGIGAFLNIHEGPAQIGHSARVYPYEEPLFGSMFLSDEPGYYEDGEFGIRLETIVMTKNIFTPYRFGNTDFLGFEAMTLVPFETHLIEMSLLTRSQIKWLNEYNARIRAEVAEAVLAPSGLTAEYEWVMRRTQPIEVVDTVIAGCATLMTSLQLLAVCCFALKLLV